MFTHATHTHTHTIQVRELLVTAREGVRALLNERVSELHTIAGALIDKETLTADQITTLLAAVAGEQGDAGSSAGGGSGGDKQPGGEEALGGVLTAEAHQPAASAPTASVSPAGSAQAQAVGPSSVADRGSSSSLAAQAALGGAMGPQHQRQQQQGQEWVEGRQWGQEEPLQSEPGEGPQQMEELLLPVHQPTTRWR